jgi:hypothetical protein
MDTAVPAVGRQRIVRDDQVLDAQRGHRTGERRVRVRPGGPRRQPAARRSVGDGDAAAGDDERLGLGDPLKRRLAHLAVVDGHPAGAKGVGHGAVGHDDVLGAELQSERCGCVGLLLIILKIGKLGKMNNFIVLV